MLTTEIALAGGPLHVSNGQPVLWSSAKFPIPYNLDQGDLGPFSQEEAVRLMESAFDAWQSVPNTDIRFSRGADLEVDVTDLTIFTYLNGGKSGINPIIFDDDGSIIRALYGRGAENDILGFAGPVTYKGNEITSAHAVFNGYIVENMGVSRESVFSTVLHEFGHFIGLDHSQVFRHLAYNGVGWDDLYTPIMLPTYADDDAFRVRLSDEDAHSLASLYPDTHLGLQTGSIQGQVKRNGQELPGINVIARRIGAVTDQIYTTISGYYSNSGGDFAFDYLPPGSYQLTIEPIDPAYYGASSIGQYALFASDLSFTNPPPMRAYHLDPSQISRSAWSPIEVDAGGVVQGIVIHASSASATSDETDALLLSYDIDEWGGTPALGSSLFQYLLVPDGTEGKIDLVVQANSPLTHFEIHVGIGQRVPFTSIPTTTSLNGMATVRLGEEGDVPLTSNRYFFDIRNLDSVDLSFRIRASIVSVCSPTPTPSPTPKITPTVSPTPVPGYTPLPTPTAIEVNPALGLAVIDKVGGTYPRGAAVHNFDIGISGIGGNILVPGIYDGLPDSAAMGPFLLYSHGFYPVAKDMEFTGERDPAGNGSEGVYFLIGGTINTTPPVTGRLGATGGPNRGGIDTNNQPADNVQFGAASGDRIPLQKSFPDNIFLYENFLVDLEPAGNEGFYVLDIHGRIYAEGQALESLDTGSPPPSMNPEAPAVDLEIFRGRTIDLSNSRYSLDLIGEGAYILDRQGGIHSVGNVPLLNTQDLPLTRSDSEVGYYDMEWIPNPAGTDWIGLGVLRGDGIIFLVPFQDVELTPELQAYIQYLNPLGYLSHGFSFDIARGFEVEISDSPIYGKDDSGETLASVGRRVGVFMVDGFGGIHTGGQSTRYIPLYGFEGPSSRIINGVLAIPFPINSPYFGVDVIQDLELSPWVERQSTLK